MVPVFCAISYDKYDIVQNTGTIPVEQKQHYDRYDIGHNTGTIPVEQKQHYDRFCSTGMVPVFCVISYLS
jgi:hypothetical protein